MRCHIHPERRKHLAGIERRTQRRHRSGKGSRSGSRNLVTAELGKQLLLRRQIQIFVLHNLLPHALEVVWQTVDGNPLVVLGLEHVLGVAAVDKAALQLCDAFIKLLGLQHFVGQGRKTHVEEIAQFRASQSLRLGQARPDPLQVRTDRRLQVGQRRGADIVTDHKEQQRFLLRRAGACTSDLEQGQIHVQHRLQETHIGALKQAHLILPHIHNDTLGCRERKERRFALKVLVLTTLATIRALDIHHEHIAVHATTQPDTLRRLLPCTIIHHIKVGPKQPVQERRFTRRLRAKHGADIVPKAGLQHTPLA